MKNPLAYQKSEYDCGPTTMMNAISYLFDREKIPPDVVKYVMMYCLDTFDEKGVCGKSGTSKMAMMFLSNWLNQYGRVRNFPVHCKYIAGAGVNLQKDSEIMRGLKQGGVVITRLIHENWHYVVMTGYDNKNIHLFDPYYRKRPYLQDGIKIVNDHPTKYNRLVDFDHFDSNSKSHYALGAPEKREAVLIFNSSITNIQSFK